MRDTAIAGVLLLFVSPAATPQISDVQDRLEAAERRWAQSAPEAYEYTFNYSAFYVFVGCEDRSFRTKVLNDAVVSVSACDVLREKFATVPQLFSFLREVLAMEPDTLDVRFDPEMGYPTSFGVDYEENVSDDSFDFEVTDFAYDEVPE